MVSAGTEALITGDNNESVFSLTVSRLCAGNKTGKAMIKKKKKITGLTKDHLITKVIFVSQISIPIYDLLLFNVLCY